jgi:hypothetical protein
MFFTIERVIAANRMANADLQTIASRSVTCVRRQELTYLGYGLHWMFHKLTAQPPLIAIHPRLVPSILSVIWPLFAA